MNSGWKFQWTTCEHAKLFNQWRNTLRRVRPHERQNPLTNQRSKKIQRHPESPKPPRPDLAFLNRPDRKMVSEQVNPPIQPTFRRPELRDVETLVEFRFRLL